MVRYTIAQVKPDALKDTRVNIGVIVQSDRTIRCKFVNNISQKISGTVSSLVFDNLNDTYGKHLSRKEGINMYSEKDNKYVKVRPTQKEYLFFIQNINKHQLRFTDIQQTKETEVDKVLTRLYKRQVISKLPK